MRRTLIVVGTLLVAVSLVLGACAPAPAPARTPPPSQIEQKVQPPDSPSSLIGEAVSQSTVSLQWSDNSENEDGFRIYRDGNVVATIGVNSTIYQDTGLEAGKTYHYIVKAYNAAGESGASSSIVKTPNPPLNVTINYIGVKDDHDPWGIIQGPGDIRLFLVVSDGNQSIDKILPPGEGTYPLNDYETMELNQRVFHTAAVGDYIKIGIIAYDDDDETWFSKLLQVASILAPMLGVPYLSDISAIALQYEEQTGKSLFENTDDYVGYFEGFWGSDESWGIGQHSAVGTEDFRVWLSIWSDSQPEPVPKPTLLPKVTIQNVDLPAEVEVGKVFDYVVTLRNDEAHPVDVRLNIHSSVTGDLDPGSATVPANSTKDWVAKRYKFEPTGVRTMTYTILYNGQELDSVLKTVTALPKATPPTRTPLSVNFGGWYVNGSEVTAASKDDTIVARINLSGGDSGQYTMLISRDIALASDQTVRELSFTYDGVLDSKELSFTPPYATGEASTDGYHVQLLKSGTKIWGLPNSYPPRLRVAVAQGGETTTLRFEVLPRGGFSNRAGILKVVGNVAAGEEVSGEISVTAGGNKDIAFSIEDPLGNTIYTYPGRIVGSANFNFVAQHSGSYTLIFDNSFSVATKKSVELRLRGGTAWVAGETE